MSMTLSGSDTDALWEVSCRFLLSFVALSALFLCVVACQLAVRHVGPATHVRAALISVAVGEKAPENSDSIPQVRGGGSQLAVDLHLQVQVVVSHRSCVRAFQDSKAGKLIAKEHLGALGLAAQQHDNF